MTIKTAYDALMEEVCVRFGFCGCIKDGRPLHVDYFIPSRGPVTADQFVEWVFLADDMNPHSEPKHWGNLAGKVKAAFITHMGAEIVDAKLLKWSDNRRDVRRYVTAPLFRRIEIWRRMSPDRALRYNCVQHLQTGEFRVCTADSVEPGASFNEEQARYFVENILDSDDEGRERQGWFGSLEAAIFAHDEAFES
jgi:hypothetical protein